MVSKSAMLSRHECRQGAHAMTDMALPKQCKVQAAIRTWPQANAQPGKDTQPRPFAPTCSTRPHTGPSIPSSWPPNRRSSWGPTSTSSKGSPPSPPPAAAAAAAEGGGEAPGGRALKVRWRAGGQRAAMAPAQRTGNCEPEKGLGLAHRGRPAEFPTPDHMQGWQLLC
jgi:hypothetical protein